MKSISRKKLKKIKKSSIIKNNSKKIQIFKLLKSILLILIIVRFKKILTRLSILFIIINIIL